MGDELSYDYHEAEKMCFAGEVKTPFATGKNMDEMKAMLANANPDTVDGVAQGWGRVRDMLVKGDDSVRAVFDKAVDHILQHWEGSAAEGFAAKAKMISTQINDTATYAHYTSTAMQNAANVLRPVKAEVDSMEKPSTLASMGDKLTDGFDRNEDWQQEIRGNRGAQSALDNHEGSLSAGKEAQLRMAAKMETLALAYTSQTKTMGTWSKRPISDKEDYPGDPGGTPPVPVVVPTSPSQPSSSPKASATGRGGTTVPTGGTGGTKQVRSPRETGITGGVQKPPTSTRPQVGTAIDGFTPPPGGTAGAGGGVGGAGGGVGAGGTIGGGAGGAGGGTAGLPGGIGGAGGARGNRGGGAGSAAGRAGAGGRGGMPGAGGAGAGAGGRGGSAAGRGGSLARRGGGVVGAAKGTGSGTRGTPGGSGLHKSRGAAGAGSGGTTGRGANRMMGRGQTDRTEEEERREGERPDYLVEDEETWTPERNNAPRVIE
ncbi:hypothetical protein ABZ461_32955 [Actinacidiphila glaucinigra]|uniref:hypothetical protein n=1 Tax=Actinacidiphila glaucinigra TaxID=235986 RepID=UPI0033EFD2CA